jgi:uncharacterized membrane protein
VRSAWSLGLLWLVVGVVIGRVGWLGGKGRLPRQHWAGIRLPSTMRSDETWRAAHRAGGPWLVAAGLATALGGAGLLLTRPAAGTAARVSVALIAVLLILLLVGGTIGVRAARRIDQGVQGG